MRLAGLVVAISLFFAACGDDGDSAGPETTTDPQSSADVVISLEIIDGDLVGGSRQQDVEIGDSVEVVVSGNTDDKVHIHGYDLFVDLEDGAGRTAFDALIPGTFEIELEDSSRLLIRMTVS